MHSVCRCIFIGNKIEQNYLGVCVVYGYRSWSVSGDYLPHFANIKKAFMLKFPDPAARFMPL